MKKLLMLLSLVLIAMLALGACSSKEKEEEDVGREFGSPAPPEAPIDRDDEVEGLGKTQHVEMETTMGTIKIELYPELAPKTVENFVTHAKDGYYDGILFHRVIDGFMIQGGDPMGNGTGGASIWKEPFEDEFSMKLLNYRGAISMANAGPNTNGSQFFIVQAKENPYPDDTMKSAGYSDEQIEKYKEGGTPMLDGRTNLSQSGHTVFGYVTEGMDVVDAIAATPVDDPNSQSPKPVEDVKIISIKVLD